MRTTRRCAAGSASPSRQRASNRMVSFEKPVEAGISIAPTATSARPATSVSHRVSCRAVVSGSRTSAPTDGDPSLDRRSPEIPRCPNSRQDGGFDDDDNEDRDGAHTERRPGILPRHDEEVPGERVPDSDRARAARRPGRLRPQLLAPGGRARLDVVAGAGGVRGRQRQRERPGRPRPGRRRLRRPRRTGAAAAVQRRGRRARALRARTSTGPRPSPGSSPATSSPPGRSPSYRHTTGWATSRSGPMPTAPTSCSPA